LDELINDYEVTTVSGFNHYRTWKYSKQGEKLIWNKLDLEVIDMDGVK
jgi:putative hemolysin